MTACTTPLCMPLHTPLPRAMLAWPSALAVAERGATPAGWISPALPTFCRLLGRITPVDPQAPPLLFQVNLPLQWNGRSLQYGGGGFNGTLTTGLGLPTLEQEVRAPFAFTRALPLCEWPMWPRYRSGDTTQATSFECTR